jgi:hypothetical protein
MEINSVQFNSVKWTEIHHVTVKGEAKEKV